MVDKPAACQAAWSLMCPCLTTDTKSNLVELRSKYEQQLVELAAELR